MGFTAADDNGVSLARPIEIVGVAAFPAHQFGVFGAPHRLTDAELGQRQRSFSYSVVHLLKEFRLILGQLKQRAGPDKNSIWDGGLREAGTLLHFS